MLRLILIFVGVNEIYSLDNGVALTPPMGWSSWLVYGCESCDNLFNIQCFSEASIKDIANTLVDEGYARLGYEFIILDDGWQSDNRDGRNLQPNSQRFPDGMRSLADYIHNKNLKLALFSDLGSTTGCRFPGSAGHFREDAFTFAQWGVDYVKMSAATASPDTMNVDYLLFGDYLQKTNRPMVYATSWPVYQQFYNRSYQVNYWSVATYSNTWRFYGDIQPRWRTVLATMDYYASIQLQMTLVVKPGAWNDADLLLVGVNGVTLDQCKAQMAVWSIMPSPLIISTHPKILTSEQRALLENEAVIAVNQDSLGLPGYKYDGQDGNIDIWMRPIGPTFNGLNSYAIAFINRNEFGIAINYTTTLQRLELNHIPGYYVTDLFPSSTTIYRQTPLTPTSILQMQINPSGVAFFKAEIITNQSIYLPYMPAPTDSITYSQPSITIVMTKDLLSVLHLPQDKFTINVSPFFREIGAGR